VILAAILTLSAPKCRVIRFRYSALAAVLCGWLEIKAGVDRRFSI
jgi:hypothetical protein